MKTSNKAWTLDQLKLHENCPTCKGFGVVRVPIVTKEDNGWNFCPSKV